MHSKVLLALTFGACCLAAPVAGPKDILAPAVAVEGDSGVVPVDKYDRRAEKEDGKMTTDGYGMIRREKEEKSADVTTDGYGMILGREGSDDTEVTTEGYGMIPKRAPTLSKRTGFGIISGGTDEA